MSITIHPALETRLRARAAAERLTLEDYLESLIGEDQDATNELEALATAGVNSGAPIETGPGYWEEKHRRLDERLNQAHSR